MHKQKLGVQGVDRGTADIVLPKSFFDRVQVKGQSLDPGLTQAEQDQLRAFLKKTLLEMEPIAPLLAWRVNDLYYWYYRPLLSNLLALRKWLDNHGSDLSEITVDGSCNDFYSSFTSKGDESSAILFFPEFLYPRYLRAVIGDRFLLKYRASFRPKRLGRFVLARFRNYLLWVLKLALLLIQLTIRRGGGSGVAGSSLDVSRNSNPSDVKRVLFLVRSRSQLDAVAPLAEELVGKSVEVDIFYDPTLHESLKPAVLREIKGTGFYWAPKYAKWKALKSVVRLLWTKTPHVSLRLQIGDVAFQDNLVPLARELTLTSGDMVAHLERLKAFVSTRTYSSVVTAEMVSPYAFAQADVFRGRETRFFNFQSFASPPDHSLQMTAGDGLIVQSNYYREKFLSYFPEERDRCFYFGQAGDPLERQLLPKTESGAEGPRFTVVFFSQPYNQSDQVKIVEALRDWLRETRANARLLVKLHPRDRGIEFSGLEGVRVIGREEGQMKSNREWIWESDLVVSRTSSVLKEALVLGKPYLACLFSPVDRTYDEDYLDGRLGVRVVDAEELRRKLLEFDAFRSGHLEARADFMGRYFHGFQWERAAKELGLSGNGPR